MAEKARPPLKIKRQPAPISSVQVMFAMILSIGLLLAINFGSRLNESQPVQAEYDRILEEIAQLEREQIELIAQRDYVDSDVYVERWARDNGKMRREGETLIIPVPSGGSVEATPLPQLSAEVQTTPPDDPAWMLWWSLFFDSLPPGATANE